jgi:hypothetical protein
LESARTFLVYSGSTIDFSSLLFLFLFSSFSLCNQPQTLSTTLSPYQYGPSDKAIRATILARETQATLTHQAKSSLSIWVYQTVPAILEIQSSPVQISLPPSITVQHQDQVRNTVQTMDSHSSITSLVSSGQSSLPWRPN